MSTYTLNIDVNGDELKTLKESGYKLCLAKKVNGLYTVVWSGNVEYLQHNVFQWTEEYQVFGTNKFKAGALVTASTNEQDIQFGQTCTLNTVGNMGDATGSPDQSGKFYVKNEYGNIALGVSQKMGDNYVPIFVSPTAVIGQGSFEPIVSIQVWFSMDMVTGTMIFGAQSNSTQVKYSGSGLSKTVAYKGGKWVNM